MPSLEVLFSPAEFAALRARDLRQTTCVVFDVLRATSSMITALGNGATAIIPTAEIAEALQARRKQPEILLAGERNGVRIEPELTGGVAFDLGNSPREFTRERVFGRMIAMTTTNGTRALRACAHAHKVLLGSFLNLQATASYVAREVAAPKSPSLHQSANPLNHQAINPSVPPASTAPPPDLLLVCSGTWEQAAYEDVLGAGALCDSLWSIYGGSEVADSAAIARALFCLEQCDLLAAMARSRNGRRLSDLPDLCDDVPYCLQRDNMDVVAEMGRDGAVRVVR